MLRKLLLGAAVAVPCLLLAVASRSDTFHVERSIVIAAPPERAFAQVNDFHAWTAWSPYEKLDPGMARTYEGPSSGPGAAYAWAGNDKVGKGRMTITKSVRPSEIAIDLEFVEPFACTNAATFRFEPAPEGTRVTWSMDGQNKFVGKAMSIFVDMDALVGGDFERGLASLKSLSEAPVQTASASPN